MHILWQDERCTGRRPRDPALSCDQAAQIQGVVFEPSIRGAWAIEQVLVRYMAVLPGGNLDPHHLARLGNYNLPSVQPGDRVAVRLVYLDRRRLPDARRWPVKGANPRHWIRRERREPSWKLGDPIEARLSCMTFGGRQR